MQATDIHGLLVEVVIGEGRTNADFDFLRGALTHDHVVHLLQVNTDRIADLLTSNTNGFTQHRAAKAEHSHLSCSAADVNDHRADRFSHRQTGTNGRSNRFVNEVNLAGTSHAGFPHGAALNTGHTARNSDNQPRSNDSTALVPFGDEGLEHLLSGIEVSDDAIPQGTHSTDVARRATQHQFGFIAHGEGAAPLEVKSHDRGLLEHNSSTGNVNQGVGCSKVNADVA